MKTLVIHPDDRSTDFLKPIYADIQDKTVITGGKTKKELIDLVKAHDRIIMMGHGCPSGLFKVGVFPFESFPAGGCYVIDKDFVPYLKVKENVYIWCNADQFVRKHNLSGFFSGMFVSEAREAIGLCANREELYNKELHEHLSGLVTESNDAFSSILARAIVMPLEDMYKSVISQYYEIAKNNKVADYNQQRLYKVKLFNDL